MSDLQAGQARAIVTQAGQRFDYRSFPEAHHNMHSSEPELYVEVLREWAASLDD